MDDDAKQQLIAKLSDLDAALREVNNQVLAIRLWLASRKFEEPQSQTLPVTSLAQFSVRVRKGLRRARIETVADLLAKNESDLWSIKNFGAKAVHEIKDALAAHGIKLAE